MIYRELPVGAVFTWRERFPDHILMQKVEGGYTPLQIMDAGKPPCNVWKADAEDEQQRIYQWQRTKESIA